MILVLGSMVLGAATGVLTGLLPGLHPNSVIFMLLPFYFRWSPSVRVFVGFATGMSVVHTFTSFIPSIFVGAPEGDTALSVLPGHRYLQEGRGFEALQLTIYGGLISALTAFLMMPLLFAAVPPVYGVLSEHMHILLSLFTVFMVWNSSKRYRTTVVIVASGLLGVTVLSSPAANTQYILFPLFAGLFGVSVLVPSIVQGSEPPVQGKGLPVGFGTSVKGGVYGFVSGMVAGFLPGVGSSQSALLVSEIVNLDRNDFMAALGGITTSDLIISLSALYVIGKARSGASVAIQQVAHSIDLGMIVLVTGMGMASAGIAAVASRQIGRLVVVKVQKIDYTRLMAGVIIFIVSGAFLLSGWFGVLVLVTSAGLGITASSWNVRKSNCMGVLILPTILYYTGISPSLF